LPSLFSFKISNLWKELINRQESKEKEHEAYNYIRKKAMDSRKTIKEIAESIVILKEVRPWENWYIYCQFGA